MKSLADSLGTKPQVPADVPELPKAPLSQRFTAKDFCLSVINSPEYRQSIMQRIVLGCLPPQIEAMIWDRADGKVVEKVEWKDTTDPLEDLSAKQLEERAMKLLELARQLRDESSSGDSIDDSTSVH